MKGFLALVDLKKGLLATTLFLGLENGVFCSAEMDKVFEDTSSGSTDVESVSLCAQPEELEEVKLFLCWLGSGGEMKEVPLGASCKGLL
mmetsp:Transcript_35349/g.49084  ORF Transcript_35349/g.49084 Transcript_35349/m.49084 type:complete len:89 (-) Transcript_35349:210-476(-)